jgi:hypothetical protein
MAPETAFTSSLSHELDTNATPNDTWRRMYGLIFTVFVATMLVLVMHALVVV